MRFRLKPCIHAFLLLLAPLLFHQKPAEAKPLIVATVPALGQIAEAVGGVDVYVKVLSKVGHDPNISPASRPSHAKPLANANLLFLVGFNLESGWLPSLIKRSGNKQITPGSDGYFDGAFASNLIGVSRGTSSADVGGWSLGKNPYWWLDPEHGVKVAQMLAVRLSEIDAVNAERYLQRAKAFTKAVNKALPEWEEMMKDHVGSVIAYHNTYDHFMSVMGVELAGFIEPKSGIEPSTRHLTNLLKVIEKKKVRQIWVEPYKNRALAKRVADESGTKLVILPDAVEGTGTQGYIRMFDEIVARIARLNQ